MQTARHATVEHLHPSRGATTVGSQAGSPGAVGHGSNGSNVMVSADRVRAKLALLRADPRRAIQEDTIHCLICGREFRQLTNTHLRAHTVSAEEYKRRFGYNRG